jgi:hypothetical protein
VIATDPAEGVLFPTAQSTQSEAATPAAEKYFPTSHPVQFVLSANA